MQTVFISFTHFQLPWEAWGCEALNALALDAALAVCLGPRNELEYHNGYKKKSLSIVYSVALCVNHKTAVRINGYK